MWKTEQVMSWLASIRAQAARYRALAEAAGSGAGDGVKAVAYDNDKVSSSDRRDSMERRIIKHHERVADLEAERREIGAELAAAAMMVQKAGAESGMHDAAEYVMHAYVGGRDPEETARAMGVDRWTARAWPRKLAPWVFDRNPARFGCMGQTV